MRMIAAAAILTCLIGPALSQGVTVVPDLSQLKRRIDVDVVALVTERYPATLSLLEREFPTDYAALMDAASELDDMSAPENTLMAMMAREFTELKRRYAGNMRNAPTASHAALLGHLAAFYDRVFKAEGPAVCGRFAQDGTAALAEEGLSETYAAAIDQQSAAYFDAVVKAIEAPEPSEPVTAEDWESVMSRMIEAGAPASFAATIGGGNPGDPNLCPALTALFITISVTDTPEAARARADFAQNLTGY